MTLIKMRLKDIVKSDNACSWLGLSVWCVNEGANGDDWIEIDLIKAKEFGLL